MSAYLIATYDINDKEAYGPYVEGVIPLLIKHQAEIIVADYETQTYEGKPLGCVVVLKFPTEENARAWYNDPDYSDVKKIRLNSTSNGYLSLAKEFVMP